VGVKCVSGYMNMTVKGENVSIASKSTTAAVHYILSLYR